VSRADRLDLPGFTAAEAALLAKELVAGPRSWLLRWPVDSGERFAGSTWWIYPWNGNRIRGGKELRAPLSCRIRLACGTVAVVDLVGVTPGTPWLAVARSAWRAAVRRLKASYRHHPDNIPEDRLFLNPRFAKDHSSNRVHAAWDALGLGSRKLPRPVHQKLRSVLYNTVGLRAHATAFTRELDRRAVSLCGRIQSRAVYAYNYFIAGGDPVLQVRREQAARAYPAVIADVLCCTDRNISTLILGAIDAARPLAPVLAAAHNIPPWVVRRLVGLTPQRAHKGKYKCTRALAHAVHALGPEIPMPTRRMHFAILRAFAPSVLDAHRRAPGDHNLLPVLRATLAASRRSWDVLAETFGDPGLPKARRLESLAHRLQDISHYLDFIIEQLQWFARTDGKPNYTVANAHAAIAHLFATTTFAKLGRLSDQWHARWNAARDRFLAEQISGAHQWPALMGTFTPLRARSLTVVPLTSVTAVNDEARAMGHCVDRYAAYARHGWCQLFSVRTTAGRPRVSVEVAVTSPSQLAVVQARGPRNAALVPGSPEAVAVDELDAIVRNHANLNLAAVDLLTNPTSLTSERDFWFSIAIDRHGTQVYDTFADCVPRLSPPVGAGLPALGPFLSALSAAIHATHPG
jgi:hypothetical protein